MKYFLLSLLIISTCYLPLLAQGYSGGSGTTGSPYQIANKADLKYLSEHSDDWALHFKQIANITFLDSDFESGGDFYNGGEGFIPIGRDKYWDFPVNSGVPFIGSYNGQDYEITNLYINRPDREDVGFFGYVGGSYDDSAIISHIIIIDADVTGGTYTGVLAGRFDKSIATYCGTSGTVTGHDHVGGFIGSDWGLYHTSSISYCWADVDVNSNGGEYDYYYGGFMGRIIYDISIDQCYATGDVNVDVQGYYCGGFIGRIYLDYGSTQSVTNCFATGDVQDISGGGFISSVYIYGSGDAFTCTNCYSCGNRPFIQSNYLGVFSNCFYDYQKSEYSTTYSGITPKTTAQMKTQSTFTNAGWNFSTLWAMTSSSPYKICGYPYLQTVYTPYSAAPDEQSSNLVYSNVYTDRFKVNWTDGNGYKNAVFVKQASTGSAFPSNYETYSANATFGNGEQIGSTGWYCVYNGSNTYVYVTGLSEGTSYITHVCSYDCDAGYEMYNTTSATNNPKTQTTSTIVAPTTQATNITFASVTMDAMNINWTNGNGSYRAVFVKQGNNGTASPVDNTTYTANTTFGSGTQIGTSGWFCVYRGTSTSVSIAGLAENTSYQVHVCDFNGSSGSERYNAESATDNPKNQTTSTLSAPTIQATDIVFSDIYSSQMTLGWTLGNGANRVVFAKQTSAGTTTPIDNTTYTASATFGSGTQIGTTAWYCIYNGNGSAAMVTGLAANTDYTFQVFEYNASPGSELYLITTATNNPKTQATNNTDMPNNALSFDRSGDYVNLGSPTELDQLGTGSYTIEAWIKTSYTSRQAIIGNYGSTPAWCFELYSSGQLRMYVNNTGYNSPSTTDVDDGLWHHVVGVREINTNIIMYVDGEEVYNRGSDPAGSFTFNRNTYIGAIPYSSNHYYFSGEIDEVRIWNTARTQAQILDNMHNRLTGSETGLVAYYNMDAGSGTTLEDNKTDGTLDGTIYNAIWASPGAPPILIWDGFEGTDWSTAGNWDGDVVPNITYNIDIPDVVSDPILASGTSTTVGNLKVQSGGSLTINSGGSLITYGNIANSGTISNELDVSDGVYHIISPPNNNTVSGLFTGDYLLEWSEPNQEWSYVTATGQALIPVTGYYLWGIAKNTTHVFSGTPNTGNQSLVLTAAGTGDQHGFNLVGNPYPSSIDWATLQPTYGAAYLWNPTGSIYVSTTDAIIAPMQGFFVYTASSTTFSLQNANRSHGGTYYKSDNALSNGLILQASYGEFSDEFRLEFDEQATAGFTLADDAWKLFSSTDGVSQLYSECPDGRLSIDVRPMQPTIQLGFSNSVTGEYSISLKEIAGMEGALLEDTQENTFTDLTTKDYTFNWNPADSEHRFLLHLSVTGLPNQEIEEVVTIYNSGQKLYLNPTNSSASGLVTVTDLAGRQVVRKEVNIQGITSIELQVSPGVYLVSFGNAEHSVVKKIIVQ